MIFLQIWAYFWLCILCLGYFLIIKQCIQESKNTVTPRKSLIEESETQQKLTISELSPEALKRLETISMNALKRS